MEKKEDNLQSRICMTDILKPDRTNKVEQIN